MSDEQIRFGCDGSQVERDGLPDDTQALYDRLLADGAAWRAEQPAPSRLNDEIAALMRSRVTSSLPIHVVDTRSDDTSRKQHYYLPRYPKGASDMPSNSRVRGLIAGGAMAAVVALLAFVLINAAAGRHGQSPAHGTNIVPTGSSVAIPAGRWVTQTKLEDTTSAGAIGDPAIAPTDPRVVYEAVSSSRGDGSLNISLRRTDDAGATWHALPLPVPAAGVSYVNLFVSPLNARNVWLQLSDPAIPNCPADESGMGDVSGEMHGGILASGTGFCGMEWYSSDAGQHWTPVKLPVSGLLSGTGLNTPALVAQSSRLYAFSGCVSRDCTRLLTSSDGGATWRTADSGLSTNASTVCDIAPVPSGSTLFAVTSGGDCSWLDTTPHIFWRSDDAGASWTQVETLPFQYVSGLLVAQPAGATQPVLYADMPTKTGTTTDKVGDITPVWSDAVTDLKYSTDGGKTWHAAPAAGAPANLKPSGPPLAILSDGSVVWEFSHAGNDDNTGGSLYVWKAGDTAWRLLTPAIPNGYLDTFTVVSSAGRGDQLWAVTREIPTYTGPIPSTPGPFETPGPQMKGAQSSPVTTYSVLAYQL